MKYTANFDLEVIKDILSNLDVQTFTLSYGDNQVAVLTGGNVRNVITQKVIR